MKRDISDVHMRYDTSQPLYVPVHILDDPLEVSRLRKYLMDGLFLN